MSDNRHPFLKSAMAWRQDSSLRLRLRNISHLLSGNFASGLISLAAIALTARAVGPDSYGIMALAFTYVRAVERLVTFQSWQPLIKYGAEVSTPEFRDDFKILLKFGLVLDIIGAILAWIVAITLAWFAGPLFGLSGSTRLLVIIFCSVLLFNISGTATAILRLYGRYHAAAYGPVGNALIRVMLCAVGFKINADLSYFVFVWMATQILGSITFLAFAIRALRENGIHGIHRASLRGVTERFTGIWSFAWQSNVSLTIRSSAQQLDILLVGALADPASAGFYHIAKQVGRMALQIGVQVQSVLYPDVARLWAAQAYVKFRQAILQVEVMLAGFGLAITLFLVIAAKPILRLTAGPAFEGAAPLMIVQGIAVSMMLIGFPARSALLAIGQQRRILTVEILGTTTFYLTALLLIPFLGAMGANFAHIVLGVIWLFGLTFFLRRCLPETTQNSSCTQKPAPQSIRQD